MVRQSKKALGTAFYVPNDEKGREFINSLRFYLNRKCYRLRVRGRNEKRQKFKGQPYTIQMCDGSGTKTLHRTGHGLRQDIPFSLSSYFAVYVYLTEQFVENLVGLGVDEARQTLQELRSDKTIAMKRRGEELDRSLETLLEQITKRRNIRVKKN